MTSTPKPEPKGSESSSVGSPRDSQDTAAQAEPASLKTIADAEPDAPAANAPQSTSGKAGASKPKAKDKKTAAKRGARSKAGTEPNNVRKLRQEAMMSKAELARRAGVSPLTIDRVEAGCPSRMDTKRKILEALGLPPSARAEVWPNIDKQS